MKCVKKDELAVINGGYLVEKGTDVPVNHPEFVKLQQEAHYLVNLANTVRATDFEVKEPVTFESVVAKVKAKLADESRQFVAKPEAPARKITDTLAQEALGWLDFQKSESKAEKINKIMQKFNTLAEFEEFGLYFSFDGIVKLKELYSLEQIIEAITTLEPHLDVK